MRQLKRDFSDASWKLLAIENEGTLLFSFAMHQEEDAFIFHDENRILDACSRSPPVFRRVDVGKLPVSKSDHLLKSRRRWPQGSLRYRQAS